MLATTRAKHRLGYILRRVPSSGGGNGISTSSAAFFYALQQVLSFRTRHHLCRQGATLAGSQQLHPQDPMPVQVHCTEGRTGSKGRGGANRDGNGVEDRKDDDDGDGDRNESSSGIRNGSGSGTRNRGRSGPGNGDEKGDKKADGERDGRELRYPPDHDKTTNYVEEGVATTRHKGAQIPRVRGEEEDNIVGETRYGAREPAKAL